MLFFLHIIPTFVCTTDCITLSEASIVLFVKISTFWAKEAGSASDPAFPNMDPISRIASLSYFDSVLPVWHKWTKLVGCDVPLNAPGRAAKNKFRQQKRPYGCQVGLNIKLNTQDLRSNSKKYNKYNSIQLNNYNDEKIMTSFSFSFSYRYRYHYQLST